MKLHVSLDLEHALVAAVIRGQAPVNLVPAKSLTKDGQDVLGGIEYLLSRGKKPPFTKRGVTLAAADALGADKSVVKAYLDAAVTEEGEEGATEVLKTLQEQLALQQIAQESAEQLSSRKYNPDAFRPLLESKGTSELVPAASLIQDGKLPPAPTGVPISLPTLQEISGGVFGLWVIGGKSGVGKSTLAVQLALEVTMAGVPVLYYDMENGESVMLYRIGKAFNGDVDKVKLVTQHFYMRRTVRTLDSDIAAIPAPALVVIDSIQKLPTKQDQRRTGIDGWLHKFEALKKQGYTVLMVSEINSMGGFKESGEIEYTADLGFQLWPTRGGVEVQVLKNRHRPQTGTVCALSRVNDWWFKEVPMLGGPEEEQGGYAQLTNNQAEDLGL